ncbi:MAG: helix-turn-helix transcriptional regulator [Ruminococcaceae bacterium]|nr:helix-turn-helix transcriptional regulator [Oscillospiraceae bacterium]
MRKEKKLTQKEVANKLNISESYYNQIENGERQKKMNISLINKLSKILDISIIDLISLEEKD